MHEARTWIPAFSAMTIAIASACATVPPAASLPPGELPLPLPVPTEYEATALDWAGEDAPLLPLADGFVEAVHHWFEAAHERRRHP